MGPGREEYLGRASEHESFRKFCHSYGRTCVISSGDFISRISLFRRDADQQAESLASGEEPINISDVLMTLVCVSRWQGWDRCNPPIQFRKCGVSEHRFRNKRRYLGP
jgi:hypothetical protein